MKNFWFCAMTFLPLACAGVTSRVEKITQAASFHPSRVAIAAAHDARGKGVEMSRVLAQRLQSTGLQAVVLEESDSVVAGALLGVDVAADPHLIAEIRRATEADGIVFMNLEPNWQSMDIVVLNAMNGELVLRAKVKPQGDTFSSVEDVVAAAAKSLSGLTGRKVKAIKKESSDIDEIPMP
jgi:hypothetical protein